MNEKKWEEMKKIINIYEDSEGFRKIVCGHEHENGSRCEFYGNCPQAMEVHKSWRHRKNTDSEGEISLPKAAYAIPVRCEAHKKAECELCGIVCPFCKNEENSKGRWKGSQRMAALAHYRYNHLKKAHSPNKKPGEVDFRSEYFKINEGWKKKEEETQEVVEPEQEIREEEQEREEEF